MKSDHLTLPNPYSINSDRYAIRILYLGYCLCPQESQTLLRKQGHRAEHLRSKTGNVSHLVNLELDLKAKSCACPFLPLCS